MVSKAKKAIEMFNEFEIKRKKLEKNKTFNVKKNIFTWVSQKMDISYTVAWSIQH